MRTLVAATALLLGLAGCAGMDWEAVDEALEVAGGSVGEAPLTEGDIAAGLREALVVGTQRAVQRLGRMDGFWQNAGLRIPLPDSLKKAEKVMRQLGQDKAVDEFHLSLNRAAEQAVPEAASIFADAIRGMTLADARGLLEGRDDAATQYFRGRTSAALAARFRPIVTRATNSVGATRKFKDFAGKAGRFVPGLDPATTDLDGYVTERALAGLFTTLAQEEKSIRENPAARTSELLRRVFGR